MRKLGYSLDEIETKIKEDKIIDKKDSREYFNRSLYKMIQMYKEQEENTNKSIYYEKQYQNLEEEGKEIYNRGIRISPAIIKIMWKLSNYIYG